MWAVRVHRIRSNNSISCPCLPLGILYRPCLTLQPAGGLGMPECSFRRVLEDQLLCSNEWKLRGHFRDLALRRTSQRLSFEKDQPLLPGRNRRDEQALTPAPSSCSAVGPEGMPSDLHSSLPLPAGIDTEEGTLHTHATFLFSTEQVLGSCQSLILPSQVVYILGCSSRPGLASAVLEMRSLGALGCRMDGAFRPVHLLCSSGSGSHLL